jgi:hypothetical protein
LQLQTSRGREGDRLEVGGGDDRQAQGGVRERERERERGRGKWSGPCGVRWAGGRSWAGGLHEKKKGERGREMGRGKHVG